MNSYSPYTSAYPAANQYPLPAPVSKPVINAPVPQYAQSYAQPNSGVWTTGLCSCCDDCSSCCIGLWCPCVLVGRSVEAVDEGATSCCVGGTIFFLLHAQTGCGCLYSCLYRRRLRDKYGLPESPCGDVCTDCCCLGCSICQVYREIENRNMKSTPFGTASAYPAAPTAPDFQYMSK